MNILKFQPDRIVKILLIGLVAIVLFFSGIAVSASFQPLAKSASNLAGAGLVSAVSADKISTLDFQNAMRKLWEEHVTWTRLFIISVAADLPDKDVAAQRLLQNQADIGNAVKAFYGDAAGDQLTALLRDHILIAADLLVAVKSGDTAAAKADSDKWYANADAIATFLSSANPKNWPLNTMKSHEVDIRVGDHDLPFLISSMSFGSQNEIAFRAYAEGADRLNMVSLNGEGGVSRIVAMSFCEPRSCIGRLSS